MEAGSRNVMRDVVVSDDLLRAIAESGGEIRFVNAHGEVIGRFEPELTPAELQEVRRRLTSSEPRYTTDQVLDRLRSAPSP
jgi:hypothetical protein